MGPSPRYVAARPSGKHHDTSEDWAWLGRRWGYLSARDARSQRNVIALPRRSMSRQQGAVLDAREATVSVLYLVGGTR